MVVISLNSKARGTSIAQYAIIIALIAIVLVPLLFILGHILATNFSDFSTSFNPSQNNNISSKEFKIKAGELNGTINKPVSKCLNGVCSIDYGDMVLNGIPENLEEYVQGVGSSGGEEKLADLIMQVAEQYKDKGDTEAYEDFKKFSNLAHIQADIIGMAEDRIKSTPDVSDFKTFFETNGAINSYKLPSDLSSTLPNIAAPTNLTYYTFFCSNCGIANARNMKLNYSAAFSNQKPYNAAMSMVDIYDTIQSKTNKYPESLRNLAQELFINLNDLTTNTYCSFMRAGHNGTIGDSMTSYDPVNGNSFQIPLNHDPITDLNEVIHPQYSLKEDLTGTIICTAGKNQATAKSCH